MNCGEPRGEPPVRPGALDFCYSFWVLGFAYNVIPADP